MLKYETIQVKHVLTPDSVYGLSLFFSFHHPPVHHQRPATSFQMINPVSYLCFATCAFPILAFLLLSYHPPWLVLYSNLPIFKQYLLCLPPNAWKAIFFILVSRLLRCFRRNTLFWTYESPQKSIRNLKNKAAKKYRLELSFKLFEFSGMNILFFIYLMT